MKLQYMGHSCFRIISEMGTTIVCDPFNSQMVGIDLPKIGCDVVTISHHHDDHDCLDSIKGNPAQLDGEISCLADDVVVDSFASFHDKQKGKLRGTNHVFRFVVDGISVVHMGDIGELNLQLVDQIAGCDVLLLPVGGTYTVDATDAKWYVDRVCPKIVVPMHYKTPMHNFEIDTVESFLHLFDDQDVVRHASETLVLNDVPTNQTTKVIALEIYQD